MKTEETKATKRDFAPCSLTSYTIFLFPFCSSSRRQPLPSLLLLGSCFEIFASEEETKNSVGQAEPPREPSRKGRAEKEEVRVGRRGCGGWMW